MLLVPLKGTKTSADAAITFVDERNLTPEQRAELEKMTVIVRERITEAADAGRHLASQVVRAVKATFGGFNQQNHTDAWRFFGVRPPSKSTYPERTNAKFCLYDVAFWQYVYTDAWIAMLVAELSAADPIVVLERWRSGSKGRKP